MREDERQLKCFAPLRIGYRKLHHERWTATPLYELPFGPDGNRPRLAITVTLQRGAPDEDVDFEGADRFHLGEARREEIKLVDAYDRDGAPMTRLIQLSLDTMAADDG